MMTVTDRNPSVSTKILCAVQHTHATIADELCGIYKNSSIAVGGGLA